MAKDKNKAERDAYANAVELGMCTTCRKQPAMEDSTRCYDCNEIRKKKFFPPRTASNRVKKAMDPRKIQRKIITYIKNNKVLFKPIGNNLYITPSGTRFSAKTITYYKDAIVKGKILRIRNETKLECDAYVAYYPENDGFYVIPVEGGVVVSIYFTLEEIEKYKDAINLLQGRR